MHYGICNLSLVPLRLEASDKSELVSQLLYGDHFKVLEKRKNWSKIRLSYDDYEGYVDNKQFLEISEKEYQHLDSLNPKYSADLVEFVQDKKGQLLPILLGSSLNGLQMLGHKYEGNSISEIFPKTKLIETASMYLNTPYLWGGKSPFGIDCSGFTQMVYKINGYELLERCISTGSPGRSLKLYRRK